MEAEGLVLGGLGRKSIAKTLFAAVEFAATVAHVAVAGLVGVVKHPGAAGAVAAAAVIEVGARSHRGPLELKRPCRR